MPTYPELDPFYPWLGVGPSEFDQFDGMALLCLAKRIHNRRYAELARDAFDKSISKQATDKDYPCGSLIKKADAARVLGDMNGCVKDLTEGFHIGDEIKSLRRLIEASDVISNMSDAWKKETDVQDLQKDISNAIVVVRRNL